MFVLLNLICIQRYRLVTLCDFRSLPWPAVCCDRVCQECSQHGRCQLHGTRLSHQTPSGNDTLNISVILQFYYQGILASLIWVNDIQFLLTERPFILVQYLYEFHSIISYMYLIWFQTVLSFCCKKIICTERTFIAHCDIHYFHVSDRYVIPVYTDLQVIDMPEHNTGQMGGTMRLGKRKTVFNAKTCITSKSSQTFTCCWYCLKL